jgi:hypothetical protein
MITEKIMQKYPKPVRFTMLHANQDEYCIGGAICLYFNRNTPFPMSFQLATQLRNLNREIPQEIAELRAERIIKYNDLGKFEDAWCVVKDVENWREVT